MIGIHNATITAIASAAILMLSACSETSSKTGHEAHSDGIAQEGHADGGDHEMVAANASDMTLGAVKESKVGQTLPYFNSEEFTPIWLEPGSEQLRDFHRIPEFEFTNQSGQKVSSESYDDKIYVATFFFATCPGICSPINHRLLAVQDAIKDQADVRILSHSITPEIDTVEVLKKYEKKNDIDGGTWDLVTGKRDDLYAVAKSGYFASEDLGEGEAKGDFKHTENILLIDRNAMIRGVYNGLSRNGVLNLITDIALLRKEQPPA